MSKPARRDVRPAAPQAERSTVAGELLGLGFLLAALLSGLALLTHDPHDASWGAVGAGADQIANAVGPFGANLSHLLLEAFGWVGHAVPVVLLAAAVLVFLRRRLRVGALRALGATLLLLAASALVHLFVPAESVSHGAFPPGGLIGRVLGTGLAAGLGHWGGVIVAGAMAAGALLLVTQLSLHETADTLAEGTARRMRGLRQSLATALDRATERRAKRRSSRELATAQKSAARAERQAARDAARAGRDARQADPPAIARRPEGKVPREEKAQREEQAPREEKPKGRFRWPSFGLRVRRREAPTGLSPADPSRPPSPAPEARSGGARPDSAAAGASARRASSERRPAAAGVGAGAGAAAGAVAGAGAAGTVATAAGAASAAAVAATGPQAPVRSSESAFLADAAREVAVGTESTPAPAVGSRATISKAVHAAAKGSRRDFRLPPTDLLDDHVEQNPVDERELMGCAKRIIDKCAEFGVGGQILQIHPGPVVTTFEFKPDAGVKLSRIVGLEDDLAMALKAETIRIDRIPGKSTVGIEVPNRRRELISFRELVESDVHAGSPSCLSMILGKTIDGAPYVADLTKMPHLLIAGSTGSGKSVALNTIITSMLFKGTPDDVKFIMVDPKMLELGMYRDIPHLLTPVVTNPKLASNALKWGVREMELRYALLAGCGVRNIEQYNAWVERETKKRGGEAPVSPEGKHHERLPFIVIVIDELADLMMIAANDVEDSICRLAQMARAVGIHLILATQRPSVDVITGVIKANLPARIAMRVASKIDSRTILDANGGEQLLGKGDMLFLPSGSSRLLRLHGPYLSEVETQAICDYLRGQRTPEYDERIVEDPAASDENGGGGGDHDDELFDQAARIVVERGEASTSYLQRRLKVGYSRAARLVDMLEEDGIVGPSEGSKTRKVLVGPDWFAELDGQRAVTEA